MKFEALWNNHPTISSSIFKDDAPCLKDGERAFENQCAIRSWSAVIKLVAFQEFASRIHWHGNFTHDLAALVYPVAAGAQQRDFGVPVQVVDLDLEAVGQGNVIGILPGNVFAAGLF